MGKIVIHVYQGMIQNVFSDDKNIDLRIFDFDSNCRTEEEEEQIKKSFQEITKGLCQIY